MIGLAPRVEALLGDSLGAFPFGSSRLQSQGPRWPSWLVGLTSGLGYAVIFCLVPWLSGSLERDLLWLSAWGSCYLAFAVTIARHTSAVVLRQITYKVIPWLSESSSRAIDADLVRVFKPERVWLVSLTASIVATFASVVAIYADVHRFSLWTIWWAIGYLGLYLLAARTTYVACFYRAFTSALPADRANLYPLDPAQSPLIKNLASVSLYILTFWSGIALSVISFLIFRDRFVHLSFFVVSVASFFSLGFGTLMFVRNESMLRGVVSETAALVLREIEKDAAELWARRSKLQDNEWDRLRKLTSFHTHLSGAGTYKSIIIRLASLGIPLAGPAATLIINWEKLNKLVFS